MLTVRIVSTEVSVEAQILEAMNLIVYLNITYKSTRVSAIVLILEQSYRVLRSISVRESCPVRISQIGSTHRCLIETTKLFETILRFHLTSRIKCQSSTYSTTICIAVVDIHTLRIQVECQVLIQEGRREVNSSSHTLHTRCLEDTILACQTNRSTVWHILGTTHDADVVVCRNSSTIDFFLPICVSSTEVSSTSHECTILVACHYIQSVSQNSSTHVTVVRYFHF